METFVSKAAHSSPLPHLKNARREKNDISGQKKKEENTLAFSNACWKLWGCLLCQTPNILNFEFWIFQKLENASEKSWKVSLKKLFCCCFIHWGCASWMFPPFKSLWHHYVSPKSSSWWGLRRKTLRGKAQVWVLLRVVFCCSDSSAHSGLGYFCCRRKLNE